jgi:hypothetical protein
MPRPRPTARRWAAAALAAALAATAACSDDDGDAASTAVTLELTPSTTATTTPDDQALGGVLLDELPLEGFVLADPVLGAGPMDLDAAASAEADPAAERSLLEETGFERGASRTWLATSQDVVYVAVYDFATPEGAATYLQASTERLEARGATGFDVPEVPGATGVTTVEDGEEGPFTGHGVLFATGDRWVLVLVASPTSARPPEDARAVAAAQAARLG